MAKATRKPNTKTIDFSKVGLFNPDKDQQEVLKRLGESMVVSAGAGSGKTGTLTFALAEALINYETEAGPLDPENILAITYTKAAATELKERVVAVLEKLGHPDLALAMNGAWISTIHSFCMRILKKHASQASFALGFDSSFGSLEEDEAKRLLEGVVSNELDNLLVRDEEAYKELVGKNYESLLESVVSAIENERLYPEGSIATMPKKECAVLNNKDETIRLPFMDRAYKIIDDFEDLVRACSEAYAAEKRKLSVVDFSDLIQGLSKLLEDPGIANSLKDQFALIFIDEFQDTNYLQFNIFLKIADDNLVVVGDVNQSIYAFQGADVSVFNNTLSFASGEAPENFNPTEVKLQNNYRSKAEILESVNEIFGAEALFGKKFNRLNAPIQKLNKLKDEDKHVAIGIFEVAYHNTTAYVAKAQWIAESFARLRDREEDKILAKDMVILLRSRSEASYYMKALQEWGFESILVGGKDLYKDPVVLALIETMLVVDNPLEDQAVVRSALSEIGRVGDETLNAARLKLYELRDEAFGKKEELEDEDKSRKVKTSFSLYEAMCALDLEEHDDAKAFIELVDTARDLALWHKPSEVLRYIIAASGLDLLLKKAKPKHLPAFLPDQSLSDLSSVISYVENLEAQGESFRKIAEYLRDNAEGGLSYEKPKVLADNRKDELDQGAVRIMTIHASKGLEFPVVAVPFSRVDTSPRGTVRTHFLSKDIDPSVRQKTHSMSLDLNASERSYEEGVRWHGSKKAMNLSGNEYKHDPYGAKTTDANKEKQEECRLAYVATTRAEKYLFLGLSKYTPRSGLVIDSSTRAQDRLTAAVDCVQSAGSLDDYVRFEYWDKEETSADEQDSLEAYIQALAANSQEAEVVVGADAKETGAVGADTVGTGATTASKQELSPHLYAQVAAPKPSGAGRWIEQFSASDLDKFVTCPRQYWMSTVLRLGEVRAIEEHSPAERGVVMHSLLEYALNRQLRSLKDADQEELRKLITRSSSSEKMGSEALEAAIKIMDSPTWKRLIETGLASSELQFVEDIQDDQGRTYYVNGYIDAYALVGDKALIVDFKSGVSESKTREQYKNQASCYALHALREGAKEVEVCFLHAEENRKEGLQAAFTFKYTSENEKDIEEFIGGRKKEMEETGFISEEEIKEGLKAQKYTPHCASCAYLGALCKGVKA